MPRIKQAAQEMLNDVILPFWMSLKDPVHGGFYGLVDFDLRVNKTAEKGCILNSRILDIYATRVYSPALHRQLVFFDRYYQSIIDLYSYGHDIESSWLIDWGCALLGDEALTARIAAIGSDLARSVYRHAYRGSSLLNECERGVDNTTRVWWVQAEAVLGFVNEYQKSGDPKYRDAAAGIVRTHDLKTWERLPNLVTLRSPQQRNVDLLPSFVNGKYAFYTRPMDDFIDTGSGGGVCFGLCDDITHPVIDEEIITSPRRYHTITESKNGEGATPIQTDKGWLHIAHGVRNTAAGLRYVIYVFVTDLAEPWKVIAEPAGFLIAPRGWERVGDVSNVVFTNGAIELDGKFYLVARVEGNDRKSFFAVAESSSPVDGFRFWDKPIELPDTCPEETNVYDMRLTKHEDGWIYGVFCSESKDTSNPDLSAAVAAAGIVRTHDLKTWERLPNPVTLRSPQQRNVDLLPNFVNGKYAFYTRPMDDFIDTGSGGGVGFGLCDDITHPVIDEEIITSPRHYHTITEAKNGEGATPIQTDRGWLHIAHGVRNTAAGLRYVIYVFVTDLAEPWKVIAEPSGFLIAPRGWERVGDVSNVVFTNGAIARDNGEVYIYYAASDTRLHVASTTVDRLLDFAFNTPADPLRSRDCVAQRCALIDKNRAFLANLNQ